MGGRGKASWGLLALAASSIAGYLGFRAGKEAGKPKAGHPIAYDCTGRSTLTANTMFEEFALSELDWESTPVEARVYLRLQGHPVTVMSQLLTASVEDRRFVITVKTDEEGEGHGEDC